MDISSLHIPVEGFFNLLLRNANIGCWVIDIKHKRSWWSDSYYDLLGIENKNEVQSFESFIDGTVHPEDRRIVTASIKHYLYEGIKTEKCEVRLKKRCGGYSWFDVFSEAKYDADGQIECIFGSLTNIDALKKCENDSQKLNFYIDVAEEMMGIGTFETNFKTGQRVFSKLVYDIFELPYDAPISEMDRDTFYSQRDVKLLADAVTDLRINRKSFDLELQLITVNENKVWIRTMGKPVLDDDNAVIGLRGIVQKIEKQKLKENFLIDIKNRINEQKFFLDETSTMSNVGGWEVNLEDNAVFWSHQTKKIHEVLASHVPTLEEAFNYYLPPSRIKLQDSFTRLLERGESFDLELQILTAMQNQVWVRAIGKPVYNFGRIIKVRGVLQNITEQKLKEIEIQSALDIINGQNDKLKDFTYIVSHNLRSHAGNLKMITEMVELETDLELKLEWIDLIKNVSSSLSETVNNLNGLVSLNFENRTKLNFSETFTNIQKALNYKLMSEDVLLTANFSECEHVDYVPAYLESIMLNLITNAIKYKHPGRKPVVGLLTGMREGKPFLKVKDNGLGIDLKAHGNRLFKMNQTFHQNSDARGIGLYITKNQVESMGGAIEVESEVDEGTTFTILF